MRAAISTVWTSRTVPPISQESKAGMRTSIGMMRLAPSETIRRNFRTESSTQASSMIPSRSSIT